MRRQRQVNKVKLSSPHSGGYSFQLGITSAVYVLSSPHSGGYSEQEVILMAKDKLSSPQSGGYSSDDAYIQLLASLSSPHSGGYSYGKYTKQRFINFLPRIAGVTPKEEKKTVEMMAFFPA